MKEPKIQTPNLALKSLRKICGLTGKSFAKKMGISYRTLVAIEVGQRNLTEDMANRIMFKFGVLPSSIMDPWREPPLCLMGGDYTLEYYKEFSKPVPYRPLFGDLINKAAFMLSAFNRAALKKGQLMTALYLFQKWLDSAVTDLDMKKEYNAQIMEDAKKDECSVDHLPLFELRHNSFVRICGRTMASTLGPAKKRSKPKPISDEERHRIEEIIKAQLAMPNDFECKEVKPSPPPSAPHSKPGPGKLKTTSPRRRGEQVPGNSKK